MSEIKNGGLDQYGVEPLEQQQFGTAGIERVKVFEIVLKLLGIDRPANLQMSPTIEVYMYIIGQIHQLGWVGRSAVK